MDFAYNSLNLVSEVTQNSAIRGAGITYFEKDHLGSVRVVVSASGTVISQNDYTPFGSRLSGGLLNDDVRMSYNGMELQTVGDLGLIDYGFRLYDPELGRWMGPDRMQEAHPGYSPYAYVANSPVNFIDLYGLDYWSTNDPAQIEEFMRNFSSGSFAFADLSSWKHTSDADFLAGLFYNDETHKYWLTTHSIENDVIVVTARSFNGLPSNKWNTSIDPGEFRTFKPNWADWLKDSRLGQTWIGEIVYNTVNDIYIGVQSFVRLHPQHLNRSIATPQEIQRAGITTLTSSVSLFKLSSFRPVNAAQYNVIQKGTGVTSATNGGANIRYYNQTLREIPALYNTFGKFNHALTVTDYVSKTEE